MYGECAWMASMMLFRTMVWDVDPIIDLHHTTEKDKVLLPPPPRNNRKEIATSTQLSLQVQCASVARMTSTVNGSDFVVLSFFFFFCRFQPKATRAGDEKHRKKSTWPNYNKTCFEQPPALATAFSCTQSGPFQMHCTGDLRTSASDQHFFCTNSQFSFTWLTNCKDKKTGPTVAVKTATAAQVCEPEPPRMMHV